MTDVICGSDLTERIEEAVKACDLIVTDDNVARLYPDLTRGAYVIPAGEVNKNADTLFGIIAQMQRRGVYRSGSIAAIGGGVVGDITGFAAAVYMRGVSWISIPTTLLAMIDSGLGGKTAIDFGGVKNLVGAFHSPSRTIVSASFLKTLPEREWLCGTGELIKTCLLDKNAYGLLNAKLDGLKNKKDNDVFELIRACVKIKSDVVEADPHERGLRKILNVGHTVGHALESLGGYELSHGEYVIRGMATELAMNRDIVDKAFYDEIMPVLKGLTSFDKISGEAVCDKALSDKKNDKSGISVMVVRSPGNVEEVKFSREEFVKRYDEAMSVL